MWWVKITESDELAYFSQKQQQSNQNLINLLDISGGTKVPKNCDSVLHNPF